jgi:hypothetical protein
MVKKGESSCRDNPRRGIPHGQKMEAGCREVRGGAKKERGRNILGHGWGGTALMQELLQLRLMDPRKGGYTSEARKSPGTLPFG